MHPLAALIINSHLQEQTYTNAQDYLRLYAAECHGLNSKAFLSKTNFVLRQIETSRTPQIHHAQPTPLDLPAPSPVNNPNEARPHERPHETGDDEQEQYRHLDEKPFLALMPMRSQCPAPGPGYQTRISQ
jgi:hypothetical protein